MFEHLRDDNGRVTVYPDGQPYLYQPLKLLAAFVTLGRLHRAANA